VELGLPLPRRSNGKVLLKANEALLNGRVQKMDMGHIQGGDKKGLHWLLWTGVGIDAMVVDWVEPRPKWLRRLGRSGYLAKGVFALPQISSFEAEVEIDGRLYQDRYVQILISNCRRYSGLFNLNPHAALDDGQFEVWLLKSKDMPHLAEHLLLMNRGR
jgi:diacylglycerol kinase family enzyme